MTMTRSSRLEAAVISALIMSFAVLAPRAAAQLRPDYYAGVCPDVEGLVRGAVAPFMSQSPLAAPATLRLFFHDCFVRGCDASVMLMSPDGDDEWRNPDDATLRPDGFEAVVRAKQAVDGDPGCRNRVSCADIMALAARDAVFLSGGPNYTVELGRYDGKVSTTNSVVLPHVNFTLDQLNQMFANFGLSQTDMIALSGGHTFGAASCSFFASRAYGGDPAMDPAFAGHLRQTCPPASGPAALAFLDAATPSRFDNAYYGNLQRGMGLLASDQALYADGRSRATVDLFAGSEAAFFRAFAAAMTRLGRVSVKTAANGEIRRDCRSVN